MAEVITKKKNHGKFLKFKKSKTNTDKRKKKDSVSKH